jgi:hypothetical protein
MRHALAITLIGCGLMALSSEAFAGGRHRVLSHSYVTPGGYGSSYGTSYGYSYGATPATGYGTSFGYAPQGYGTSFGYAPYGYGATRGFGMTPGFGASSGFGFSGGGQDQFGGPLAFLEWIKVAKAIRDELAPPTGQVNNEAPLSAETEARLKKVEETVTRVEGKVDRIALKLEEVKKPAEPVSPDGIDKSDPNKFGAAQGAQLEERVKTLEENHKEIMKKLDTLLEKK